ncbi:MAG TPA: hypothetical protein VM186_05590, partial [Planctomycetota bacterium]|nr:hypothetical protein [Planctomycetota bacterium]
QLTYIPSGGVFRSGRAYCATVPEAYAEFIVELDAPMKATSYTEWANTTFHGTQTRLLVNGRVVVDDMRAINWPERGASSFWLRKGLNTIRVALCYEKPDGQRTFLKLVWLNLQPLFDDVLQGSLAIANEDVYFYKGGEKTFRLHLSNLLDRDVSYNADVEIRSDRGRVFAKESRELALKANADADVDLPLTVEAAGLLAAEVSLHTPRGVMKISQDFCSLHRIPIEYDYDSPLILSWYVDHPEATLMAERAVKVGYRWTSDEIWWRSMEPEKQGGYAWDRYDRRAELARKYKTYVIPITGGCPEWANLWHGETPAEFKRQRAAWMVDPKHMDWYESYVTAFVNRYGDIAKAIRIWNEPWEGGGISGWSGRGDLMQQYIIAARKAIQKSTYKDCLVMSNDSVFNYQDNLEWNQEASDAVGVGSDHPYGGLVALQLESGRYFAYLGKPCWNTESWDRLDWPIKSVCLEQSLGVTKSCPHEAGHLLKASTGICQANALLRFAYHAKFDRQINPQCMPWMFAFKAKDEKGRNFAIVFGRIDNARRYGYTWDQIAGDGTLTVADRAQKFSVFDCYGNPVDAGSRKKQIPLNNDPYFIATTGELDELTAALQESEVEGITPVQIGVYDITRPFDKAPVLKVELTNALNIPLSGKITVEPPGDLRLKSDTLNFKDLVPGKRTVFELPIERGEANAASRYPLKVTVKTPRGQCSIDETVSLALIKRGTPTVDGDLTDWEKLGAVPVFITPRGSSLPASEAMRLLMWTAAQSGEINLNGKNAAKVAAMYDEKNFYVMAQVLDGRENKADRNHARVSMRGDWYKMQKPPADILYAFGPVFPGGMFQIAFDCIPADKQRQYYPPDSPYYRRVSFFDTDYEFSIYDTTDRGPEVWCNMAPGMRYDNAYPYTPKGEIHQDIVDDARVAVTHDDEMRIWKYECAIPLSRIPDLKPQPGATTRFNFLIKCVGHWTEGRSTCVLNRCTFHPSWEPHYSDDVEWGFVE